MNILLAVDGSEVSLRAVDSLARHVQWFRESPTIHLLHVHLPIPIGFPLHQLGHDAVDRYYREEGEAILAPARERLEKAGLATVSHVHVGHPAETVVKLATELPCELICLGTHGRGALGVVLLGSVAGRVLQMSAVPVLLAK